MESYNSKIKVDVRKRSYYYGLSIIKFIDSLHRNDYSCEVLGKQLLRSATSIGANIIEAQASASKKDFTNFLIYALKSANESKFWLALLRDSGKAKGELVNPLLEEVKEISNILGASILTLKNKR